MNLKKKKNSTNECIYKIEVPDVENKRVSPRGKRDDNIAWTTVHFQRVVREPTELHAEHRNFCQFPGSDLYRRQNEKMIYVSTDQLSSVASCV